MRAEPLTSDEFESLAGTDSLREIAEGINSDNSAPVEVVLGQQGLAEPAIATFTCRLPFTLGMTDEGEHHIIIRGFYADANDVAHFGSDPYVVIRIHNQDVQGYEIWPEHAAVVMNRFYGTDPFADLPLPPRWGEGHGTYEQWVTIETPRARLVHESETDPAYSFHRCIDALNIFLSAHNFAIGDLAVRPVTTQDLRPIVFTGFKNPDHEWSYAGVLLMHAEALPYSMAIEDAAVRSEQLSLAVNDIMSRRPFISFRTWRDRALRAALHRGDYADAIVSLQAAMESMIFDLWKMLMLERGKSLAEVEKLVLGTEGFKYVVTKKLSGLLGGTWDVTLRGRPVGEYWVSLYEVRNRIVHTGFEPQAHEFELAKNAFDALNDYINSLLWKRHRQYPKTLLTKRGVQGLRQLGWFDTTMRNVAEQASLGDAIWPWRFQ
jgi:hypothetical protein